MDPLAGKYAGWSPYTSTLDNPVWLVGPTEMAVDSSYTINENIGQVITTGDRGGDDMDYIYHLAGSFTYDEVVKVSHIIKADGEIIRGEVASVLRTK